MSVYLSLIRIGLFCVDATIGLDVLKCTVHQASIASHVAIIAGAVHQLLLTQRNKLSGLPEVLTLEWASLDVTYIDLKYSSYINHIKTNL